MAAPVLAGKWTRASQGAQRVAGSKRTKSRTHVADCWALVFHSPASFLDLAIGSKVPGKPLRTSTRTTP